MKTKTNPAPFSHAAFPGTPLQQRDAREKALAEGLRALAKRFDVTLREPLQVDSNGEFSLVTTNGPFGDFAIVLNRHSPRCGTSPGAVLDILNCWCRLHHFDVEKLLTGNPPDRLIHLGDHWAWVEAQPKEPARPPRFNVGNRVTFTNDQGVVFPGKTITEIVIDLGQWLYRYAPTDCPWFAVREDQLTQEHDGERVRV